MGLCLEEAFLGREGRVSVGQVVEGVLKKMRVFRSRYGSLI